jgi:predicted  nucleic acid-binding Zn-ribbon protein
MEDSLGRLEEKVLKAVRVIQELRGENDRLQHQRTQLEADFNALQERSERLTRDLEEARSAAATVASFEEQRRILEEKVGGLLEKLDQIG